MSPEIEVRHAYTDAYTSPSKFNNSATRRDSPTHLIAVYHKISRLAYRIGSRNECSELKFRLNNRQTLRHGMRRRSSKISCASTTSMMKIGEMGTSA
jgi:hypothetical protein